MQIAEHKVVTLDYTLTDDAGTVLDQSRDGQFVYLHGAFNIVPGLEEALAGKTAGEELNVSVPPEKAYGPRDEGRSQVVSREMFDTPEQIDVGRQFHAQSPDGEMLVITVTKVDGDNITIDGNHPLAGITLNFDVKVVDVRDATTEELEHGHVHGPGGHQHD